MRVQDVAARAGLAAGLFYRYFHDLREIVAEIARDFFAEILARAAPARSLQGFEWIRVVLIDAVRQFAANPGILACLFGLAGDYEEFDQIWKKNAHKWNLQVAAFLVRDAGLPHAQANRMGFMLGAMTEGVIYQALIRRTNDIARFAAKPENVAEVLAVMWYRAIYLSEPPKAKLGPAGRAFIVAASTRRKPRSK